MKDAQAEAERILSAVSLTKPASPHPAKRVADDRRSPAGMRATCYRHHPRLAAAAAGHGVAGAVHALAGARDLHRQLLFDAAAAPPGALHRPRQLRADRRRSGVLAARSRTICWFARRHHSGLDRARDADGAVGERPHRRPHAGAHGLFHADRAADDRGRQHLAVLLHAAIRPARAGDRRVRRCRRTTGSARRTPRSPPSRSWRSGRRPASS